MDQHFPSPPAGASGHPRDALSRRQFLAGSLASGLALTGLAGQAGAAESRAPLVRKPARHVIFVLMSGAPSQLETFDPKPGAPTGGPFGTIATRIPGVRFCEYLPRLAAMTDRLAVVRSVNGPAPGGDHVADLRCTLTGHYGKGNVGVARPSFGSIVAHQLGRPDAKLPGYVNLSPSWHEAAFQGAGCLGARYDMLKLPGYGKLAGATARPDGVSDDGFRARQELRDALSQQFLPQRQADGARRYEESFARARGLMECTDLFDLSREPQPVRDRYGPTRYAADCLTARRLVEAGVPFVLIQCFGTRCDWDWHYEAFSHLSKYMLGVFDHVTTALIEDLQARGLWEETLLVCTGEFGRTPQIGSNEANGYGGRAHYGKNWAMLLGGGPIRGGTVVGATNAHGTEITDHPVTVADLYRTYYPALGIDPDKKFYVNGQPVPIQEEGKEPITELLG
jgi:Protein of unknown function (DUF1501)